MIFLSFLLIDVRRLTSITTSFCCHFQPSIATFSTRFNTIITAEIYGTNIGLSFSIWIHLVSPSLGKTTKFKKPELCNLHLLLGLTTIPYMFPTLYLLGWLCHPPPNRKDLNSNSSSDTLLLSINLTQLVVYITT